MDVEKSPSPEIGKNKLALGCPTNDFLNFQDIFYPEDFGCLGGNWSFSTATPDFTNYSARPQVLMLMPDFSNFGEHINDSLVRRAFGFSVRPVAVGTTE